MMLMSAFSHYAESNCHYMDNEPTLMSTYLFVKHRKRYSDLNQYP